MEIDLVSGALGAEVKGIDLKDSSEEKMAEINKAYEVLSDKKLNAEYDKFCKLL